MQSKDKGEKWVLYLKKEYTYKLHSKIILQQLLMRFKLKERNESWWEYSTFLNEENIIIKEAQMFKKIVDHSFALALISSFCNYAIEYYFFVAKHIKLYRSKERFLCNLTWSGSKKLSFCRERYTYDYMEFCVVMSNCVKILKST